MGEPYQHPAMACQSMPFPGMGAPLTPFDNFSMMHPMANSVIDPGTMYHPKQTPNGNYKQEDACNILRDYYKSSFFPFSNDLLKDLVNQIDIYVQILVQTLLSTKDVNYQYQLYLLLYDFTKKKESILKPLKLPKFEVPWVNPEKETEKDKGEALNIPPQVSFYQNPLLEYAHKIVKMIGK